MSEPLLLDLGPLSCEHTDDTLEHLYKSLSEMTDTLWQPHESPWLRNHVEEVTKRGQDILQRMQEALLEEVKLPGPRPLAKALPWQRWNASEFDRVRKYLNAIPAAEKTLDDWMLLVDWIVQRYLPEDVIQDEAEYLTVRAAIAGKVAANMDPTTPHPDTRIGRIVALLPSRFREIPPGLLTEREATILNFANKQSAQNITNVSEKLRGQIKNVLIDGIKKITLGDKEGTWGKLQSELFDKFGEFNRDMRKIAISECGESTNSGYIASLESGTQVKRMEAYDACPYCKSINGKIVTIVDASKRNKDYDNEVWLGKTNIGRSASPRKRVGNTLVMREPEAMFTIAAGIQHPNCRGSWVKISDSTVSKETSDYIRGLLNKTI